jgi:LmbE family N-acetylglucosaminyl deacetylase
VVDITATIERKLAALRCHVSQLADPDRLEDMIREWGSANAVAMGLEDGHLAESFQVIDTR